MTHEDLFFVCTCLVLIILSFGIAFAQDGAVKEVDNIPRVEEDGMLNISGSGTVRLMTRSIAPEFVDSSTKSGFNINIDALSGSIKAYWISVMDNLM